MIINPGLSTQQIETIVIDNLNPSTSQRSDPEGFVFGRIEAIFAANKVLGPSIQGSMLVCGQDYEQLVNNAPGQNQMNTFPNMQCLVNGVVCDEFQNVILSESPTFSETTNPWPTIMNQSLSQPGFENRTQFYPHPYDYMIPSIANGKDPSFTFLPNDHGQTFWYFVDQSTYYNQFGKNCNEIGMSIGTNSNQQNSNLWCNIDPHECLPGLGTAANGGLKNAVPCIVSQYMNIASGLYTGTNFPFPYGTAGLSPSDAAKYAFNSNTFIGWMQGNASNFVPSNPFVGSATQPLYDPKNPQFWLGKEQGSGSAFLYYTPTASSNGVTQSLSSVGINLVLDVAGNFVSYNVVVAQGQIDLTHSKCQLLQGSNDGIAFIGVTNPSNPALAASTTFVLSLDCNPPAPLANGVLLVVETPPITFTLAPGQTTVANFTVSAPNNLPTSNNINCIATLSYSEAIGANSDQKVLNCGYTLANLPPAFTFGGPTPPNPPPPNSTTFNCSGFCALSCRVNAGKVYQDGCFWIIIIAMAAVAAVVAAAIIEVCVFRAKFASLRTQTKGSTDKFVEQEISRE